jgi:hypothetical protein
LDKINFKNKNMNYSFIVDYRDGLCVHVHDDDNKLNEFLVEISIEKTKVVKKLKYNYNNSGSKSIEEEIINSEDFKILWEAANIPNHSYLRWFYKGFVPYEVKILNPHTREILLEDKLDLRYKLVNFTLYSENPEELHVWMCVIDKFRKEHNCNISIINGYLHETKKYDWVTAYLPWGSDFNQFYTGYNVGKFGTEGAPDYFYNPDGIINKNSLEIIEDILCFFGNKL